MLQKGYQQVCATNTCTCLNSHLCEKKFPAKGPAIHGLYNEISSFFLRSVQIFHLIAPHIGVDASSVSFKRCNDKLDRKLHF